MWFSDIQDAIYEAEQEMIGSASPLTKKQKEVLQDKFTRNLNTWDILVGNDFIAIPRQSHKNWLYYAGFEYIDDGFDVCLECHYIYSDSDERVTEILELLQEPKED